MKRILLVDDNPELLTSVKALLVTEGYEVHTVEHGKKALATLESNEVDLVITDIIMPEQEGIETIAALRKKDDQMPIIAMSGGGQITAEEHLKLAMFLGAIDTLRKPFSADELLSSIQTAFKCVS